MVLPKAIPSQTIELVANSPTLAEIKFAKNSPYEQHIIDVMRSLLKGDTPRGMGAQKVLEPKAIHFSGGQLMPLISYRGTLLSARVLTFTNTGRESVSLAPNEFYHSGVLAISLEHQTLAPRHSSRVFEVLLKAPVSKGKLDD